MSPEGSHGLQIGLSCMVPQNLRNQGKPSHRINGYIASRHTLEATYNLRLAGITLLRAAFGGTPALQLFKWCSSPHNAKRYRCMPTMVSLGIVGIQLSSGVSSGICLNNLSWETRICGLVCLRGQTKYFQIQKNHSFLSQVSQGENIQQVAIQDGY